MSTSARATIRRALVVTAVSFIAGATASASAQSTTPPSSEGVFLIAGGQVVTIAGTVLPDTDVLIREGRIAAVGRALTPPPDATRIDASGRIVYPGMIDSHTALGLTEMTHESDDRVEMGRFNPHLRTVSALNAHSNGIPLTRDNGITAAITQPSGGLVSGPAALIQLDGWTWEELAIQPQAAMMINYPRRPSSSSADRTSIDRYEAELAELRTFLSAARTYEESRASLDPLFDAMAPVLRGELPAFVLANSEDEIRGAVALSEEFNLQLILGGAREAWRVADLLAARRIPVILGSVLRMPEIEEPYDAVFAQAAVLEDAGVLFAFSTGSTGSSRNLPYHAGMATAYGLSPEAALRAVTIGPAEIWGVADAMGTIEEGKRADLFIADGNILDVRTRVLEVFVNGRRTSPDDRHMRLYRKFSDRPYP